MKYLVIFIAFVMVSAVSFITYLGFPVLRNPDIIYILPIIFAISLALTTLIYLANTSKSEEEQPGK